MSSTIPWYCRYGVHGDFTKEVNVDGTVVYRTREQRCDCTPPPLCSLASSMAHPRPHPPQRKSRRGRATGIGRAYITPPWQDAHVPLPLSAAPRPPGEMDDMRLHVLVPPLALDSAVGDFYAGYVSSTSHDIAAALPFIPVIRAQSALAGVVPFTAVGDPPSAATGPLGVGGCSDMLPGTTSPAPPLLQQGLLSPSVPPLAAAVAAPLPVCTTESHTVDRLCGFVFCPTCGQRVAAAAPGTSETAQPTPATCPMGPHVALDGERGTQAQGATLVGRFCFLCGTDKQAPTCVAEASVLPPSPSRQQPPLAATEGHTINAPTKDEAGASHTLSPPAAGGNPAAATSATTTTPPPVPTAARAAPPDLHLAQDMLTVDELISHLLSNAADNDGKLRPPCGLPQCRLCDPSAAAPSASPSAWTFPPWRCGLWGTAPVMCGSPAVAIIHHHYAK
ncbi:hypothetical protein Q4I32_000970 [Leishmania shawi]|uniref:Uncharacterized protein n=1 Tax=Leishmania shawi TaxID=5680 RepID=A0AAW3CAF7_9TRYP